MLASNTSSQGYGSISGRVTDEQGVYLSGVEINAIHQDDYGNITVYNTTTNSNGDYSFTTLPAGRYIVLAKKVGYQINASFDNFLSSGNTLIANFVLEKSLVLSGFVNCSNPPMPIENASVYAECEFESYLRNCLGFTDSNGEYILNTGLAPGRYSVMAWAKKYVSQKRVLDIYSTNGTVSDFILSPSCTVNVTVVDKTGVFIEDANVVLINKTGTVYEGKTDSFGRFIMDTNISFGNYTLVANKPGYVTNTTEFVLSNGEIKEVTIMLVSSAILKGYVQRTNGFGIEDALISISGICEISVSTNESGYYEIASDLLPGDYTVSFTHPAYHNLSIVLEISEGVSWCNVSLKRYSYIWGYVRDVNGKGIAGASIKVSENGGEEKVLQSTGLGFYSYRIDSISGRVDVSVSALGYLNASKSLTIPSETTLEENFTLNPLLVIHSPTNGAHVNSSFVVVKGLTQPYAQITILVNGAVTSEQILNADNSGAFQASVNLSFGTNSIRVTARINNNEMSIELKVNYQGPRLYIFEPAEGTRVESEMVTIRGRAYDSNSDINAKIYIRIDNGEWIYVCNGGEFEYIINFSREKNGIHTLTIRAEDDFGKIYEQVSIEVSIPEKIYSLNVETNPKNKEGRPGSNQIFRVIIKNKGNSDDFVHVNAKYEDNLAWKVQFAFDEMFTSFLTFPYNSSIRPNGERSFYIKISIPDDARDGNSFKVKIIANSIFGAYSEGEITSVAKIDLVGNALQYLLWLGLISVAVVLAYFAYKSYLKTKKVLEEVPGEDKSNRYAGYSYDEDVNYGTYARYPSYSAYPEMDRYAVYEDDSKGKYSSYDGQSYNNQIRKFDKMK
jgi:hypothetical protein